MTNEKIEMPDTRKPIAKLGRNLTAIVSGDDDVWFDTAVGEKMRIRIHARDVDGRFSIMECLSQPMSGTPRHRQRADEIVHVLEGALTFQIDDERFDASVGDIVVIPAGAAHAWRNFGPVPTRAIVTFAPGGLERLYTTIQDVPCDKLRDHVAHHGLVIDGPMINR